MTIQRGRGTTEEPEDVEDKVGGRTHSTNADTELVTLAKLYRILEANRRVRRDIQTHIVYPSAYIETPQSNFKVVLPISNNVEYVFPESYHPSPKSGYQVVEPTTILPQTTPYPPILTTQPTPTQTTTTTNLPTHPSSTLTLPSTPNISKRVTTLPDSWSTSLPATQMKFSDVNQPVTLPGVLVEDTTENKLKEVDSDYENWGVVVSVVKSVSESDNKVTVIIPMTTETPSETTPEDIFTTSMPPDKTTHISTTKSRTHPPHPFLTSTTHPMLVPPQNRTKTAKAISHKIHPFLSQIKSAKPTTPFKPQPTGISIVAVNTTLPTSPSTTSTSATTVAGPPSLFGRFNFLNKKTARPALKPASTTAITASSPSNAPSPNLPNPSTGTNFLRSFKSRLLNRPAFKTPSKKAFLKQKKSFSKPIQALANEVSGTVPTKTTQATTRKSLSRFSGIKRPSFQRKSLYQPRTQSVTRQPAHLVEKARTKRLPPAFSPGLLKPRLSSRFKTPHPKISDLEEDEDSEEEPVSVAPEGQQTVGELLAALQGEPVNDDPVTLRPHSFKPKSGRSNQIREKLNAQLEELEDEDKGSEENSKEMDSTPTTTLPSTSVGLHSLVLPTRLTGARAPGRSRFQLRKKGPKATRRREGGSNQRKPQATGIPQTRLRHRVRPTTTTPSTDTTTNAVHIITEVDMMDKLGMTVVSSERPDTTEDRSQTSPVAPTQSPFQVLLESDAEHEDHANHLATKHSPEIHLRLLHTDRPIELPRASQADLTLAPFLPTIETFVPKRLPVPETFLPTMAEVRPTESFTTRVHTSSTLPEPSTTTAAPSRGRSRSRSRHRLAPAKVHNSAAVSTAEEPQNPPPRTTNRRLVRPRTRTRARVTSVIPEEKQQEVKQEPTAPRARVASPRRLVSRPRSQGPAPAFRPNSGSRSQARSRSQAGSRSRVINQRLRIRGGSRSTTAKPEAGEEVIDSSIKGKVVETKLVTNEGVVTSEPVEEAVVTTPESILVTTESVVVKTEDAIMTTEVTTDVTTEDAVVAIEDDVVTIEDAVVTTEDTVLTTSKDFKIEIVDSAEEDEKQVEMKKEVFEEEKPIEEEETLVVVESHEEEASTRRPFRPKFGADARNKLREKLRQQLSDNKSDKGEKEVAKNDAMNDEPIFDSSFSDFDRDVSQHDLEVRITPPPSVAERRTGRLLEPRRSRLRSRGGRRRRLTNTSDLELHRFGRSTNMDEMEETDSTLR